MQIQEETVGRELGSEGEVYGGAKPKFSGRDCHSETGSAEPEEHSHGTQGLSPPGVAAGATQAAANRSVSYQQQSM